MYKMLIFAILERKRALELVYKFVMIRARVSEEDPRKDWYTSRKTFPEINRTVDDLT